MDGNLVYNDVLCEKDIVCGWNRGLVLASGNQYWIVLLSKSFYHRLQPNKPTHEHKNYLTDGQHQRIFRFAKRVRYHDLLWLDFRL